MPEYSLVIQVLHLTAPIHKTMGQSELYCPMFCLLLWPNKGVKIAQPLNHISMCGTAKITKCPSI